MHISNSQILLHRSIEFLLKTGKKIVLNKGVYTDTELDSLIGMELKSQMLDFRNDIQRTNKLVNGTKITVSLNELNNSDNLEDGKPSNTLFTYFVTSPEYYMHFEPQSSQYKKLKNDPITSLTLAIMHQSIPSANIPPGRPPGNFLRWSKALPRGKIFLQKHDPQGKKHLPRGVF